MKKWQIAPFTLLSVLIATVSLARAGTLVKIDRIRPYDVKLAGFILDGKEAIAVEAVGYRYGSSREDLHMTSAWILDADTREMVWRLREADSERGGRHLRDYSDDVTLPAGHYEVYYEAVPSRDDDEFNFDLLDIFDRDDWRGWDHDDFRDAADDFRLTIEGNGRPWSNDDILAHQRAMCEGALFSRTALGNDHYEGKSLELDKPMALDIYAVGEATKEGSYDTSWIVDTKTLEKVWMLDYRESDRAGGVRKNRVFHDTIKLPAGEYAIFCATDDSHSFDDWNATPPYDPYFWGVTIRVADEGMADYAHIGDYKDIRYENAVVELTGLENDAYVSQGFTLKTKTRLRVYAIGEGHGELADYSWIIDADTRERVWEMEYRDSEHAGGASKNRVVNDVIELAAGNYIAYAVTDDSHACGDWNASPPHDQAHWGLTISTVDAGDRQVVLKYDEAKDDAVLAQLIHVRDNKSLRERFTLDKDADVRIYALGEGSGGRMYDYAWIEDAESGHVVWEMRYRDTDHAGGARKNRVYNDTVRLDRGEYVLFYESDGSHSFNRWNASPPSDFDYWGVTVKLAKGKER